MTMTLNKTLLATTAFALAMSFAVPAAHAKDSDVLRKLQEQISSLQKEIDGLKKSQAQQAQSPKAAAPAAAAAVAAPVAATTVGAAPGTMAPAPAADATASSGKIGDQIGAAIEKNTGLKVAFGGFFDTTVAIRDKNQNTDVGSNFNTGIPFNNNKDAHQGEVRFSSRTSRFSMGATGAPDKDTDIGAYLEVDFAATGTNSSSVQTNNYTPRLRQGYVSYERSDWGLHTYVGQTYSLVTASTEGVAPRKESLPMVIDSSLVPGTVYDRAPQVRIAGDFLDKKLWTAISVEQPQTNYGGITPPTALVYQNTGGSINGASSNNFISSDVAPDVVAKVAFDPGFGHYEIFGLARTFRDRTVALHNNIAFAPSGGASAYFKVIPSKLEISASVAGGKSLGRYGASQLPDYAFTSTGDIKPLTEYAALFGVTGHPTPTWDIYAYAGVEQVLRENFDGGAAGGYGYGDFDLNNTGCNTDGAAAATCQAQTKRVWQVTGGVWKSLYKGNYGKISVGAQQSFTRRDAFSGLNNYAPHATESVTMASFRFWPSF